VKRYVYKLDTEVWNHLSTNFGRPVSKDLSKDLNFRRGAIVSVGSQGLAIFVASK
jgi:hypothetical protein